MSASRDDRRHAGWNEDELRALVADGLGDLAPEALEALKAELTRRGLRALARAVDRRISGVSLESVESLVTWLRSCRCPLCRRSRVLLNGCIVRSSTGAEFVLACPACLEQVVGHASTGGDLDHSILRGPEYQERCETENRVSLARALGPEPSDDLLDHVQRHYEALHAAMDTAVAARREKGCEERPAGP